MNAMIEDVLRANKDVFYDVDEMREVLNDLVCRYSWRDETEAYKYTMFILNNTFLAVRKFIDKGRDFWEPVFRYNFDKNIIVLENTESEKYQLLANFYPLSDTLVECKELLSKLNTLVAINRQTEGVNSIMLSEIGRDIQEEMAMKFGSISETRYMSYSDSMTGYKTLILNALNDLVALENVASASPAKKNMIQRLATKTVEKKEYSTPVVTEIPKAEAEELTKATVTETTVAETVPEVKEEEPKPKKIPPEERINKAKIDRLLNDKNYQLADYLGDFIEQFQILESFYYCARRANDEEDMNFYIGKLGDIFASFDMWYEKAKNTKPHRGFKPDMQKWDETKHHIQNFKNKAQL